MKERTLKIEDAFLSPFAFKSIDTKGRKVFEEPCPMRTEFQRDRDRIIHSKSFRFLKNKTQVFFAPDGDHFRTRLTHTLTVSQIARSIARTLALNEDLTEAIALGHDLGHTPFGHSGERMLNKLNPHGFKHNIQSGRVVEFLERDGLGLNLTREVVDGIINHKSNLTPATLEGKAVSIADRIAYINHDIDDAIESGFISENDLPKEVIKFLGLTSSKRINKMIDSIRIESEGKNCVQMGSGVKEATEELRAFMFERVYKSARIIKAEEKSEKMMESLYGYFKKNPSELPPFYHSNIEKDGIDTVICDYISSMSDSVSVKIFKGIYIPEAWEL